MCNGTDNNIKSCSAHSRCHDFRACDYCARIRQANVANAVERLKHLCGDLQWNILYPDPKVDKGAGTIKTAWLRAAKPDGAVWTIEKSLETQALHINIITPAKQSASIKHAHCWTSLIHGDVRNVGAYIAKRSQMPTVSDYSGKLWGTAGNLWQLLVDQKEAPVVAAAAAQYALNSQAMLDEANRQILKQLRDPVRRVWYTPKPEPIDRESNREVAKRWLPDILGEQRERLLKYLDENKRK